MGLFGASERVPIERENVSRSLALFVAVVASCYRLKSFAGGFGNCSVASAFGGLIWTPCSSGLPRRLPNPLSLLLSPPRERSNQIDALWRTASHVEGAALHCHAIPGDWRVRFEQGTRTG